MLVVMGRPATQDQIQHVIDEVERLGASAHVIPYTT